MNILFWKEIIIDAKLLDVDVSLSSTPPSCLWKSADKLETSGRFESLSKEVSLSKEEDLLLSSLLFCS